MSNVLYARSEDGSVQVTKLPDGYRITGTPHVYKSTRQLLIHLTRHPEARHWTFNRYFRRGKYAVDAWQHHSGVSPIMDLFGSDTPKAMFALSRIPRAPAVGVDLVNRHKEVAKLLFAGFGRRIYGYGYDPDDVLQEVYKGILIRNNGKCPYRPDGPASFGHYVHMVCGCIISNYHRRQSRIRAMEQTGISGVSDDGFGQLDVATACSSIESVASTIDLTQMMDKDFVRFLDKRMKSDKERATIMDVLPMVVDGMGRQEIIAIMNVPTSRVSKAIRLIRVAMSEWYTGTVGAMVEEA